jgi:hypothetical protein
VVIKGFQKRMADSKQLGVGRYLGDNLARSPERRHIRWAAVRFIRRLLLEFSLEGRMKKMLLVREFGGMWL